MNYVSYSQIQLYRQCPHRYMRTYLDADGGCAPATEAMQAGKNAEAETVALLKRGEWYSLPERWSWMKAAFAEPDGRVAAECFQHKVQLPGAPGSREFVGYIDMRKHNAIVDFKLTMLPESDEQLRLYALALMYREGYESVTAWFCSLTTGQYRRFDYTTEDLQKDWRKLQAAIDVMESDFEHEATPGSGCALCPFASTCPKRAQYAKFFEAGFVLDWREALKVIEYAKGLEAEAERLTRSAKDVLLDYMLTNGLSKVEHDGRKAKIVEPSPYIR